MMTERAQQRVALAVSAVTILVLMAPVVNNWVDEPVDGFPLSYYPMFASKRGELTTIYHPVLITRDGEALDVSEEFVGAGGMNPNRRQMRRMVRDDGRADDLAELVARNLIEAGEVEKHDAVRLDIVRSRYHIRGYFEDAPEPVERKVYASLELTEETEP